MSYTLADAHENGDYEAKECELCDRVATQVIRLLNPNTNEIESHNVCRTETKAILIEELGF